MKRQHLSFQEGKIVNTLIATGYSVLKKKNTRYSILNVHVKDLYCGTCGEIKPDPV